MTDRVPIAEHPEDLPWHDAPADRVLAGMEPDPGEVVEDGDEAVDLDVPPVPDPRRKYRSDTLDERLAEEELEGSLHAAAARTARRLVAPGEPGDAVMESAADPDAEDEPEDLSAEEAAIHLMR